MRNSSVRESSARPRGINTHEMEAEHYLKANQPVPDNHVEGLRRTGSTLLAQVLEHNQKLASNAVAVTHSPPTGASIHTGDQFVAALVKEPVRIQPVLAPPVAPPPVAVAPAAAPPPPVVMPAAPPPPSAANLVVVELPIAARQTEHAFVRRGAGNDEWLSSDDSPDRLHARLKLPESTQFRIDERTGDAQGWVELPPRANAITFAARGPFEVPAGQDTSRLYPLDGSRALKVSNWGNNVAHVETVKLGFEPTERGELKGTTLPLEQAGKPVVLLPGNLVAPLPPRGEMATWSLGENRVLQVDFADDGLVHVSTSPLGTWVTDAKEGRIAGLLNPDAHGNIYVQPDVGLETGDRGPGEHWSRVRTINVGTPEEPKPVEYKFSFTRQKNGLVSFQGKPHVETNGFAKLLGAASHFFTNIAFSWVPEDARKYVAALGKAALFAATPVGAAMGLLGAAASTAQGFQDLFKGNVGSFLLNGVGGASELAGFGLGAGSAGVLKVTQGINLATGTAQTVQGIVQNGIGSIGQGVATAANLLANGVAGAQLAAPNNAPLMSTAELLRNVQKAGSVVHGVEQLLGGNPEPAANLLAPALVPAFSVRPDPKPLAPLGHTGASEAELASQRDAASQPPGAGGGVVVSDMEPGGFLPSEMLNGDGVLVAYSEDQLRKLRQARFHELRLNREAFAILPRLAEAFGGRGLGLQNSDHKVTDVELTAAINAISKLLRSNKAEDLRTLERTFPDWEKYVPGGNQHASTQARRAFFSDALAALQRLNANFTAAASEGDSRFLEGSDIREMQKQRVIPSPAPAPASASNAGGGVGNIVRQVLPSNLTQRIPTLEQATQSFKDRITQTRGVTSALGGGAQSLELNGRRYDFQTSRVAEGVVEIYRHRSNGADLTIIRREDDTYWQNGQQVYPTISR